MQQDLDHFTATVRALSHKGLGVINHPDGRSFFVRDGWPAETGRFSVAPGAASYTEARVIEWTERSPSRVPIPCAHQGHSVGQCSGCPWMGVDYSAQLVAKTQRVKFLLEKNQITVGELRPIIAAPAALGYRNRAQFKTDGERIGYVSEGTNVLAPVEDCLVLNNPMRALLRGMRSSLPNSQWAPTEGFPWSYLDVDDEQQLADVVPNRRRPFRQGNTQQNEAMKQWILTSLQEARKDWPVMEAFCGSGNFTEALARAGFENILAAEVRGSAIQELAAKQLPGVRIMEIDMTEKGVWQQLAKRQPHAKILLIDPPREGVEKRRGIFKYLDNLQLILYVSCEPTTWARDVKDFIQHGWRVAHLTPLDLFPHTPHVELLSLLVKA